MCMLSKCYNKTVCLDDGLCVIFPLKYFTYVTCPKHFAEPQTTHLSSARNGRLLIKTLCSTIVYVHSQLNDSQKLESLAWSSTHDIQPAPRNSGTECSLSIPSKQQLFEALAPQCTIATLMNFVMQHAVASCLADFIHSITNTLSNE